MAGNLSDADHERLDHFLGEVFLAVKAGAISRDDFIEGMAYVTTAVDIGNRGEVLFCFDRGGVEHFKLSASTRKLEVAALRSIGKAASPPAAGGPTLRRSA